jgi:capsular exopolysaccharide synthesis family protein
MEHFPSTPVAEQYRMLRQSLKNRLEKPTGNVVVISSALHEEGKTVTAANLAIALAETGESKVALVDADLRRGKLADYLGFGSKREGMSDFLSNGLSLKDIMVRSYMENLVFIPRGETALKPSELISSKKFQLMMTELKRHFDYILIDAPPIMAAADAGMLGKYADGVLMVIQAGRTPKTVIAHANILFQQAGLKMLGYVLTQSDFQSQDYKYSNYYNAGTKTKNADKKKNVRLRRAAAGLKVMEKRLNALARERNLKKEQTRPAPVDTDDPSAQAVNPSASKEDFFSSVRKRVQEERARRERIRIAAKMDAMREEKPRRFSPALLRLTFAVAAAAAVYFFMRQFSGAERLLEDLKFHTGRLSEDAARTFQTMRESSFEENAVMILSNLKFMFINVVDSVGRIFSGFKG